MRRAHQNLPFYYLCLLRLLLHYVALCRDWLHIFRWRHVLHTLIRDRLGCWQSLGNAHRRHLLCLSLNYKLLPLYHRLRRSAILHIWALSAGCVLVINVFFYHLPDLSGLGSDVLRGACLHERIALSLCRCRLTCSFELSVPLVH